MSNVHNLNEFWTGGNFTSPPQNKPLKSPPRVNPGLKSIRHIKAYSDIQVTSVKHLQPLSNILRLFDVLTNIPFTTSEMMRDYYLETWCIRVALRVSERLKT